MMLISFSEEHADFEMYRDKDCHQLTRVNRFKGGCPVCFSDALPSEPYRVCRRVNILRDYPDDKIKIYP